MQNKYLTIKDVSEELSVSLATVKNWVRLEKLIPSEKDSLLFDKFYISEFKNNLKTGKNPALKTRRNKRYISGNKLYKSYVSEDSKNIKIVKEIFDYIKENNIKITDSFVSKIISNCAYQLVLNKNNPDLIELVEDISKDYKNNEYSRFRFIYEQDEDILGLLYISLKNMNERKTKGSYYTPTNIVKKLCSQLGNIKNKTVYDPCCGTGNFLLNLPDDTDFKNVFGNDIDRMSVKIARINMGLKFGIKDINLLYSHITNHDFCKYKDEKEYDYIIGNPPWVGGSGKYNYYDIFEVVVDKSLTLLKRGGILAFVLPESVLNVKSHKKIREVISKNNSIKYLEYLGNTFDGVMCPSVIIKILHDNKPFSTKGMEVKLKDKKFFINTKRKVTSDNFNFLLNDEEYELINKIENIPNKLILKNNAVFGLGIVTGDNKKYITEKKTPNNEMILKGVNIDKFRYKNSDLYISFIPEKFQQVAPSEIYRAKEKLLYRFISKEPIFAYDNKKVLPLNSCNVLIPQIEGVNIKYILAVLNSSVAQFYFRGKYNSVKVLRSHIENIPIPYVDEKTQNEVINMVDKILNGQNIFSQLDKTITKLYGLRYKDMAKL